jgi:putative FmdB family regulatory protein
MARRRRCRVPTYVYRCERCESTFERRQSFSDAPLTSHDDCGGPVRKLIVPAPVIFKGSGFYTTDYRGSNGSSGSNGSKNGAEQGDPAHGEVTKGDSAKGESSKSESSKSEASKATAKSASAAASD